MFRKQRWSFIAVAAVVAALPFLAARAQQTAGAQIPAHSERIEVRIANIDVVVTDRKGTVITGLKKEDFELLENKVPQPIVNFYEATPAQAAAMVAAAPSAPGTSAPAATPAVEYQPRRIIFYVDNLTLTMTERNRLLTEMKTFVNNTMRQGDEALVATFNRTLRVRVPFTDDKAAIIRSFDEIANEASGGEGMRRQAAAAQADIHASGQHQQRVMIAKSYAEQALSDLKQSVRAVQTLMVNVAGLEGKKAMVLASEGFPIFPGREMFEFIDRLGNDVSDRDAVNKRTRDDPAGPRRELPSPGNPTGTAPSAPSMTPPSMPAMSQMKSSAMLEAREYDAQKLITSLGTAANANGVTLYTIHAGALGGSDAADVSQREMRQSSVIMAARQNAESGLQTLAEVTGGIASVKAAKHESAFDRIRKDLDSYYSLGYRPAGGTGEREIQVRVRQRGYVVRTRRNYTQKSVEAEMSDRVLANLLSRPRTNDLKIAITAGGQASESNGKVRVPLRIHIPYDSLTLLEQAGTFEGGFDVYIVAADIGGGMSPVVHRTQKVSVPVDQMAKVKGTNYIYALDFLMNKNVNRVSVGIVDSISNVVSYARLEE